MAKIGRFVAITLMSLPVLILALVLTLLFACWAFVDFIGEKLAWNKS